MEFRPKMVLAMGISFAIPITVAGLVYAIAKLPLASGLFGQSPPKQLNHSTVCQTLTADPNPPLNVRSSPAVATDNIVGHIPSGIVLSVIDESEGWLKISTPIPGWVYKELTVTSCINPRDAAHRTLLIPEQNKGQDKGFDQGPYLMAIATQQYQSGNLKGAVALAKAVSENSPVYFTAKVSTTQWPQEWSRAESRYYTAHKALRDSRFQDAILIAKEFPDIRFWKEKLTPIVKQAIEQSSSANASPKLKNSQ